MQIQLSVGEGGFSLTTLILHHFFWLSETRIWISIAICRGLCCVQLCDMRGDCLFCCYWWNYWPQMYKLSSHKELKLIGPNFLSFLQPSLLFCKIAYPSGALEFKPGFKWDSCYSIFSVMCMFVDRCLSFVFWPLCCLFFFDVQILITPLVSSNSSDKKY